VVSHSCGTRDARTWRRRTRRDGDVHAREAMVRQRLDWACAVRGRCLTPALPRAPPRQRARMMARCGVCPGITKGGALGASAGKDCQRVAQGAGATGASVQPCPQQHVPGDEPSEPLTQRCPVRLRAADDVPIHLDRPCGRPCRHRRLDALAIWRDACIPVDHALLMHISLVHRKPKEISRVFFVRKS
jgi:hypothetical protein